MKSIQWKSLEMKKNVNGREREIGFTSKEVVTKKIKHTHFIYLYVELHNLVSNYCRWDMHFVPLSRNSLHQVM